MPSLDDLRKKELLVLNQPRRSLQSYENGGHEAKKSTRNAAEKAGLFSDKMDLIILNLTKNISDQSNSPKLLTGTGKDQNIYA